jgi:hypothetical protein
MQKSVSHNLNFIIYNLAFKFFHFTPEICVYFFLNQKSTEKKVKQVRGAWFKSQISIPKVRNILPSLYSVLRKGNLSFARTYQKDLEPDGMCLDAMLRHIVLQFARVIGKFGAFSGRLPK